MISSTDGPVWWSVELRDRITRLARAALPDETAGFWVRQLAGEIVPVTLRCIASPHHFEVIPQSLVERVYAIWSSGDEVIGTFHSHPGAVRTFSRRDHPLFEWGVWHLLISGIATGDVDMVWAERLPAAATDKMI